MDWDIREKAYRVVAYSSVAFGLAAVVATCIALPLVYNYVSYVQTQMKNELDFCQVGQFCTFEQNGSFRISVLIRATPGIFGKKSQPFVP